MTFTVPGIISNCVAALVIIVPIYCVIFRRQFIFAFFIAWFLMVVAQQFAVIHSNQLYDQGLLSDGASPTDTTTVGLTVFSGWLLALPYCGLLLLVRLLLVRIGIISPNPTGDSASDEA